MSMKNLLVIMSDQHSKSCLGAYGNPIIRTPNLDSLAAEGVRFDEAYCPAPICVPSRMSFLTSNSPSRNRVWDNSHMLDPNTPTWVHSLGAVGYRTSLIGRMHFVGKDQLGGFMERPLGEFSACPPGSEPDHQNLWSRIPVETAGQTRASVEMSGKGRTFYQWFDEQVTEAACAYLEGKRDSQQPFAAVVGYVLPHCPFFAPDDLFDYYYPLVEAPTVPRDLPPTIKRFRRIRDLDDPPISERRIRIARAAYFGMCEFLDQQIGKVLEALEANGLKEDTTVVYTSDHGEMAGTKGCWWKSSFYEESVSIPLIIRNPAKFGSSRSISQVCNLMDLGPTLCELGGGEPPPMIEGRSLLPLLKNEDSSEWENETFSEFVDTVGDSDYFAAKMIRSGPWKLWKYVDDENLPPALFNLNEDRAEENDLWGQPEYEEIGQTLLAKLEKNWNPKWVRPESRKNDRRYQALEAWGKRVKPKSDELLVPPDIDLEADLDMLNGGKV